MGKKWMQKIDCYILFFPYGCDVVFSIYSSCPAQLELCRILITGQLPTSKLNLLEHLNCFQIFNEGHFEFKQKDSLKKKKRHD